MAISLLLCVSENGSCDELSIIDSSGVYSSSNTGGYGGSNPPYTDAETATITISKLTDVATNTYSVPVTINAYSTLPNISNTPFVITAEDAGYGVDSSFEDGYYKIIYTVARTTATAFPTTVEKFITLTCQVDCCYKELANEAALCSCNCVELKERLRNVAYFHRQLEAAKDCGNLGDIMKYLELMTNLCDSCGCC